MSRQNRPPYAGLHGPVPAVQRRSPPPDRKTRNDGSSPAIAEPLQSPTPRLIVTRPPVSERRTAELLSASAALSQNRERGSTRSHILLSQAGSTLPHEQSTKCIRNVVSEVRFLHIDVPTFLAPLTESYQKRGIRAPPSRPPTAPAATDRLNLSRYSAQGRQARSWRVAAGAPPDGRVTARWSSLAGRPAGSPAAAVVISEKGDSGSGLRMSTPGPRYCGSDTRMMARASAMFL